MTQTLDERACAASDAIRAVAELRPDAIATRPRRRGALPVTVTAAVVVAAMTVSVVIVFRDPSPSRAGGSGTPQPLGQYKAMTLLAPRTVTYYRTPDPTHVERLVTSGVVLRDVAQQLHFRGNPALLAADIRAVANPNGGGVTLTGFASTANKAIAIVSAFGRQLVAYLNRIANPRYVAQVTADLNAKTALTNRLTTIDNELSSEPTNQGLVNQRNAVTIALAAATKTLTTITEFSAGPNPYQLITAHLAAGPPPHINTPNTRPHRILIAIALLAVLIIGFTLGLLVRRPQRRTHAATH